MNKVFTKIKECPPDKILNPETNNCVLKSGAIGKKILANIANSIIITPKQIECPPDKILNPDTNKCVLKTGAIGKKILSQLLLLSKDLKEKSKDLKDKKSKDLKDKKSKDLKDKKSKDLKDKKSKDLKDEKSKDLKDKKSKDLKEKSKHLKDKKSKDLKDTKSKDLKDKKSKDLKEKSKDLKDKKSKDLKDTKSKDLKDKKSKDLKDKFDNELIHIYKSKCENKFDKPYLGGINTLNKLLNSCFYEDHDLIKNNFKTFIDKSDKSIQEYLKIILDNTIYVSLNTFLEKLNLNIYSFINKYIDYNDDNRTICICTLNLNDKNSWIINYVIFMIKFITNEKLKVKISNKEYNILDTLKNNDILLFIDDCYYNDNNFKETFNENNWHQIKNRNDIIFYFMIPYISNNAITSIINIYDKYVKPVNGNIIFSEHVIINEINTIIDVRGIKLLNLFYGDRKDFTFGNKFMIYFQHSIENENLIIKPIYSGIIANTNNAKLIKDSNFFNIEFSFIKKKIFYTFEIIPIINNCNSYLCNGIIKNDCEYDMYKKLNQLENPKLKNNNIILGNTKNKTDYITEKSVIEKTFGKPDKNIFNTLFKKTFNLFPLDHSFDENAIQKFINKSAPDFKNICKKIIKKTEHISFEKFILIINKIIYELLNFYIDNNLLIKDRPIFIYLTHHKRLNNILEKSNYWLYKYINQFIIYLTNNKILVKLISSLDDVSVYNNDLIILIDDCIYSGEQMSITVNNILIKTFKKLNIFLLVPFISSIGHNKILTAFKDNFFLKKSNLIFSKYTYKPLILSNVLSKEEINIFIKYYGNFYLTDLSDIPKLSLIYFDHKLADIVSTITPFYIGVVPSEENFNILSKLKYSTILINKNPNTNLTINPTIDIIPLIKNCSYYIDNINLMSPKCPAPPYKKTFKSFILTIKELNKNIRNTSLSLKKNKKYNKKNKSL